MEKVQNPFLYHTAKVRHFYKSSYGFAWFYLGIHCQAWHGGGPPRYSAFLSVHGEIVATVRGLHSFKLSNLWLLEINTQPSSWDLVQSLWCSSPSSVGAVGIGNGFARRAATSSTFQKLGVGF